VNLNSLRSRSFELMVRGTVTEFWRNPKRVRAMEIFKRIARLGLPAQPNWMRYCEREATIRKVQP
jgi:hypothetical protein